MNKVNLTVALSGILLLQACNKELPEAIPIDHPKGSPTETIMKKLDAAEFSILKTAVEKASTFASPTGKLSDRFWA